jgi:hypothetical protein
MKLDFTKEDLVNAADFMADINDFIAYSKNVVANPQLFQKEEVVETLTNMTTIFDLLITAGSMQVETQLMIDEIENAP